MEQTYEKTRVCIFDFDDTLVFTPTPEQGIPAYEKHTGKPWVIPDKETAIAHGFNPTFRRTGWWGRKETLNPPIFEPHPELLNKVIVDAFQKAKADPDTYTVIMTGRHGHLEGDVKRILQSYGLSADQYYFKNQPDIRNIEGYPKNNDTLDYKAFVIVKKLMSDRIRVMELWDDRQDHIPQFVMLGKQLRKQWPNLEKFIVHNAVDNTTVVI